MLDRDGGVFWTAPIRLTAVLDTPQSVLDTPRIGIRHTEIDMGRIGYQNRDVIPCWTNPDQDVNT